jgi:hypothetical protein
MRKSVELTAPADARHRFTHHLGRSVAALTIAIATPWSGGPAPCAADDIVARGAEIYRTQCASCHGEAGQGGDTYEQPLVGDRSIGELSRVIDETMPDGEPERCTGEDAAAVAAYVHHAFYSPEAQLRLAPPRIELSRLTVRQYHNSIADLLAPVRSWPEPWTDQRGLKATYRYSGPKEGNDFGDDGGRKKFTYERIDQHVNLQIDQGSSVLEAIAPEHPWSCTWTGSLWAPVTGVYDIYINTKNGVVLHLNDERQPLIDGAVRSGDMPEYHASIFLLGGRSYPVMLRLNKDEEKSALLRWEWMPPKSNVRQPIPERFLSPTWSPELLVVETPFPPDDSSMGYERGTSVSQEWSEAVTGAAIEVAGKIRADIDRLAKTGEEGANRADRIRQFALDFVTRAFRRPLGEEERKLYVDAHFAGDRPPDEGLTRVVLQALTSPRFLYPDVPFAAVDDYLVSSRLALGLWDSLPDQWLWDEAAAGRLHTKEQIATQARRMLEDPRAKEKLRGMLHHWLSVHRMRELAKDPERYPEFSDRLADDLRTSLDLFLDSVPWSDDGDFRQLLLADYLYMNGRLAGLYGVDLPANADFQRVAIDPSQRAGVLSHPFLMTGFAYSRTSSPIHRGVFLVRHVLGRALKPPADAISPLSEELRPELTTRERVLLQTSHSACQACHDIINPMGFALENYDAIGRFRQEEQGKAIDASGQYITKSGQRVEFAGVRRLAEYLADSPEVHDAFVRQLFHHLVKQPVAAVDLDLQNRLRQQFADQQFSVPQLMVDVMVATAGRGLETE